MLPRCAPDTIAKPPFQLHPSSSSASTSPNKCTFRPTVANIRRKWMPTRQSSVTNSSERWLQAAGAACGTTTMLSATDALAKARSSVASTSPRHHAVSRQASSQALNPCLRANSRMKTCSCDTPQLVRAAGRGDPDSGAEEGSVVGNAMAFSFCRRCRRFQRRPWSLFHAAGVTCRSRPQEISKGRASGLGKPTNPGSPACCRGR